MERLRQIITQVSQPGLTDHYTMACFVEATPTKQNGDYTTPRDATGEHEEHTRRHGRLLTSG